MSTLPADLVPMELRAVAEIPSGPQWLYEPKWDGFRCLAHRDGAQVELISKKGQPLGRYFPEIVAALERIGDSAFSLDGELVVPRAGTLSFDALQQRIHPAASRVAQLAGTTPAHYLAFDLLREAGTLLVHEPLCERRGRLERFAATFEAGGAVRLSPATTDRAVVERWFARVGGALDGVVAKRLDAAYVGGAREGGVKIKRLRTADCVIGGFRYAANADDRVGSLLLGLYDERGLLDYIGFCSSFAAAERRELLARLLPHSGGIGFTGSAPDLAPSRWARDRQRDRSYVALRPELVLEVGFDQVTSGRIRHGARPLRWRSDKAPAQCTAEQLASSGSLTELLEFAPTDKSQCADSDRRE